MEKKLIIDEVVYIRQDNFVFYGVDYWDRVIMYNEEKDVYLKTVALDSDIIINLEKKEIHTLYTIVAYDGEDIIEGEPDCPTIFKVFPEEVGDDIEIIVYKKIKENKNDNR